jgi:hypothetical protein
MTLRRVRGLGAVAVGLTLVAAGWADPSAEAASAATGQISGKVYFQGVKPKLPEISMAQDPVCASEQNGPVYPEDGQVNANGTLPNVFVYVKSGLAGRTYPAPSAPVTLDQRRCEYVPHVLGIMVGQPLKVVSSDPTTHNIHVIAIYNRSWNVSQQPGSPPVIRRFTHPEIMISVKCNQHPWMKAYIGVTGNPFYAVTGREGAFTITNLPPGHYTLEAWTATFGKQETEVTVEAGKTSTADFTFRGQ